MKQPLVISHAIHEAVMGSPHVVGDDFACVDCEQTRRDISQRLQESLVRRPACDFRPVLPL